MKILFVIAGLLLGFAGLMEVTKITLGAALMVCGAVFFSAGAIMFSLDENAKKATGKSEAANELAQIHITAAQSNGAKLATLLAEQQATNAQLETLNSRAERANIMLDWGAELAARKTQAKARELECD